jgi:hypothetical protein
MSRALRDVAVSGLILALAIPWPALARDSSPHSARQEESQHALLTYCATGILTAIPPSQQQPVGRAERSSAEGAAWPMVAPTCWSRVPSTYARAHNAAVPQCADHPTRILLCRLLV